MKIRIVLFAVVFWMFSAPVWAQGPKQPITVNGDRVEFKSEGKEVVAEGNVEIVHQDSRMTADKIRVFVDEKLAIAEGRVIFIQKDGEQLDGDMIIYDFESRTGTIIGPSVRMPPYYGKALLMEKLSETEFLLSDGEVSTCDLPHPHYLLRCREARMHPGRLLTARGVKLSVLDVPLMYVPAYSQRLTDKRPRLMITPGHKKDFGLELFGSWRYYLSENAKGLLRFDWYQKKGWAEGVDFNYDTKGFGTGNAKYYRIDEEDTRKEVPEALRESSERSRIEVRHRWGISDRDQLVLEYFRQSDRNFRKDYFFREYEKETNPRTFFSLSHVFPNAQLSLLGQPRVNRFETVLEKIPELKLETVNQKILQTPFYYKNATTFSHLAGAPADADVAYSVLRADTSNQFSYLFRFMSIDFSPFIGHRDTYYSRNIQTHKDVIRDAFFSGVDMSMKLFKIYGGQWRHIVTPTIQYRFQREPSVERSHLLQSDDVDTLDKENSVTFALENKIQAKRAGQTVDLATLILSTDYRIERNDTFETGFQRVSYDFEFKPYEWWEFDSDAAFDTILGAFRTINADFWAHAGKANATLGYRFKKDESSQITAGFQCPLNPFWKLGVYERFEFKTGDLVEQEYTLDRDMHCWLMQFIVNQREDEGISFLLAFRLKAFPEIGINAEKTFSPPRSQ